MPAVSIVVPNYNHALFLHKRLDSILAQTFQDFELILLDDCSTDDSRSILSSYASDSRVRLEFNEKNSGTPFKQWNKGVRLARGEYVWIAESDDYAAPRLLERLVGVLEANAKAVLAYCRSWHISADSQTDGVEGYPPDLESQRWASDYCAHGRDECRDYFLLFNIIPNASAVVFRRELYQRVGGADENLCLCGDWKLWATMALTGDIAYVAEPLNHFRFHEGSVRNGSKRQALGAEEYLHVVRWLLRQVTPTDEVREKLRYRIPGAWRFAVATWDVPLGRRCSILRDAIAIDPANTLRRVIPEGLTAVRLKFLRHWSSTRSSNPT